MQTHTQQNNLFYKKLKKSARNKGRFIERKKLCHVIVIQGTLAEFVAKSKRQQIECHNNKRLTKQLSLGKANDQEHGQDFGEQDLSAWSLMRRAHG